MKTVSTRLGKPFHINLVLPLIAGGLIGGMARAKASTEEFKSQIQPFFETYCIKCHGPDKSKGKITLHSLDGDLSAGEELERWEHILDVLKFEEMPPEDEDQPNAREREVVVNWIESGLRDYVKKASNQTPLTTSRRLTNFEYQNTMRDLLGFELNLTDVLPEDPTKPYHFNNTADLMLLGPEQVDKYLDNARHAMASAIVDPGEPKVYREKWNFESKGPAFAGELNDEIGIHGGRRGSISRGVSFNGWPETGEFRIRIKAGAILPEGFDDVPLRIVMGSSLRSDAGTGDYTPVGTVHLNNSVDDLQEFEFRGRIENFPIQVGKVTKNGQEPDQRYIYPQNIFDDGRLMDYYGSSRGQWQYDLPRAVVREIEFEAPVFDVWPPEHHTRILFDSPLRENDTDAYVRDVLTKFMGRAFRRPATSSEVDRFSRLYKMLEPEFCTLEATMRETLAMVLISHQFLYHTQAVEDVVTPQFELASKLSYFLWGTMPDQELYELAAENRLDDSEMITTQVERLLADERSGDFVDNFTTQWLSIAKMHAINVNLQLFPRFLYTVVRGERTGQEVLFRPTVRDYMHEETVGFIAELIRKNAGVLNVVDSDFAWLNEPLATHYGVEGVKGLGFRSVALKQEDKIGGLPTQGSVLVGNGTGSAPHPIYRAVWLREAILGDKVKPPPAEVPALSDTTGDSADNAVTIKDLLAQHREQESCNDCHVRLDPWGIPFEQYNAIGQFQPKVPENGTRVSRFDENTHKDLDGYEAYLKTVNTVEVEANSRVPHGPEVVGLDELKEYLLEDRKEEVAENIIRRLLGYGLGRELTYLDRFDVETLLEEAKGTDYAFKDMIVAVCRSKSFRETPKKPEQQ